jgi:hypothetical protein
MALREVIDDAHAVHAFGKERKHVGEGSRFG